MATVNLGSIKFKWKGTYSGATAYTIDDVVEYNGSSYICILASTGNLPTDTTYFEQMSQAGTDGTDLTSILTTQGDIVYRDGSGLARLGAGTSGQVLTTGGAGANPTWTTVSSGKIKQTHWQWDDQQAQIPNCAGASTSTGLEVINYSFTAQSDNPHFCLDFSFFHGTYHNDSDSGDLYVIAYIEESGTLRYSFGFKKTGGYRSGSAFYNQSNAFFLEDTDGGIFSNNDPHWSGYRVTYAGVMGNQATSDTTASPSTNITAGDTLTLKIKLGGNGNNFYNRSNSATSSHSRSWFKLQELDNSL